MIELKNVTYKYPDGTVALDDVSYVFETGKCYCLRGPNGSGKSTLFRILNGLASPSSGTYFFDGEEISAEKLRDRAFAARFHMKVGYIFQNSDIQLFNRSVEDEVAFGLYQMGLTEEEVRDRADRYIKLLELDEYRKRAPFNLSGGEKKRTALAAILAMDPPVLIMDEPIAGLDEDGQLWVTSFIEKLKTPDRLIIIATHNSELENILADETIKLSKHHRLL